MEGIYYYNISREHREYMQKTLKLSNVPQGLIDIVSDAIRIDPYYRFYSAQKMLDKLNKFMVNDYRRGQN